MLEQMFKNVDEYLKEKGGGPLNSDEVVHTLNKVVNNVLTVEERTSSIADFWRNIALCIAINVSNLRGYKVPDVVRWRGKVIDTVKERW